MGEQEGWKFMDGLHDNIAAYLHSDSAPCVQAARGERVAGLALDMRGASEKTKGAPIEVVVPQEGVDWEVEATSIVKGTKNLELAKKVADWGTTRAQTSSIRRPTRSSRFLGSRTRPPITRRTPKPA
jgi:iron(III) transport system substrate-binding protein